MGGGRGGKGVMSLDYQVCNSAKKFVTQLEACSCSSHGELKNRDVGIPLTPGLVEVLDLNLQQHSGLHLLFLLMMLPLAKKCISRCTQDCKKMYSRQRSFSHAGAKLRRCHSLWTTLEGTISLVHGNTCVAAKNISSQGQENTSS